MRPLINIASVLSVNHDGEFGLFIMDSASGKFYRLSVDEVDPSTSGRLMASLRGQIRDDMPHVPREQMAEVLKAEKSASETNLNNVGSFNG